MSELTWGLVVAYSEVWRNIATDVGKTTAGAVLGSTADLGGTLPDDLGEMTPVLEVGHVWLRFAVKTVEVVHLAVIEEISNNGRDVVRLNTGSDVLAVSSTGGSAARTSVISR